MENINPVKEEEKIGNEIFERLNNIPLIDKYNAYQILDDNWSDIAIDFEVINTEGKMAIKVVEPNMVMKKDKEIQEGYKGRILPFELVQKVLLSDELNEIKTKEDKINEIVASYEELIESLTEEDKESDILNEASDAFNNKGVTLKLKELKKADSEEEKNLKETLNKYTKLNKEEKDLKKEVKDLISNLDKKTKETIENLSDEKANEMVKEKWIKPLVNELKELPNQIINELIKEVQALAEKYASTLIDIEEEIKETENELSSMIDDLCGSDFDMKGLAQFKNLLGGK